ncbi:putative betaine aldehyde dehydrogenase protein [Lasiodiplodia theobromae]|uniref:aldehyde dehydrogenase (NAD(+)) n=1 Tax=Lasiodiplodia theobromae TaxID=45133 RepID=A0A5N5DNJ0_9PEZI|nr:Betaine aldehyde dehydrogenase [Lasiodiplodia theobromae]KAB2579180.1 Gamma-aminobutyraldehyde dehydrogenase [Lasiodiplodia theobromae]KAF4537292.1 Betaine aldehyde dehydrogenase [Lasiodiplodia theobromae]KAF9639743.1 putative betaine aldehyde dehydrogenase protein [Lasiodiplodia theobromae]
MAAPKLDFTTFQNVINGKLTTTDKVRQGINPATLEPLFDVPVATPKDVDAAVEAAQEAFKSWKNTTWAERSKALHAFADAFLSYKDEFAQLLTKEQGKPIPMALNEVETAGLFLHTFADMELKEDSVSEDDEKRTIVRYTPLGVVVGIVPWNFPIVLACGKIGPSLMTGNPIIVKPSPFTPYCDLKMVELATRFFPPGVIQALSGDDNLGPWLTAHPGPAKISFTGSTATGKKVMESASKTLKRVTLELGGKDPAIVCSDVDIAATAPKVATLAFLNSGQICLAIKRIYVHEKIYDEFLKACVEHTKTLVLGNGTEPNTFLGPVQNAMQYERVKGFFQDVHEHKMKVAVGGVNDKTGGYYITPTIIDNPAETSKIVTEEPFGPIVPLLKWSDESEVVHRANDTKMGLGASVWSNDLAQAERIARQLDAGSVWINTHLELDPNAPFGGHKESGVGYEWGLGGMKAYCNVQTLFLKKKV